MTEVAVAAIGEDRPGIVAAVAGALTDVGASVEDSSMTILGGQFAMLLLVDCGSGTATSVESALTPVANNLDLVLEVRETAHAIAGEERDDWIVAAYGPDRPGLVAALATVLADSDANITDFGSRLGEGGTFAMWFNVTLPSECDVDSLADALRTAGGEVALDVTIRQVGAEAL
jgi:glycine cleavage system transcriptional repressor